jgi:hypothetical protein
MLLVNLFFGKVYFPLPWIEEYGFYIIVSVKEELSSALATTVYILFSKPTGDYWPLPSIMGEKQLFLLFDGYTLKSCCWSGSANFTRCVYEIY